MVSGHIPTTAIADLSFTVCNAADDCRTSSPARVFRKHYTAYEVRSEFAAAERRGYGLRVGGLASEAPGFC